MANKSYILGNASAEMQTSDSMYPQINDIIGNVSNYQRANWMQSQTTGLPIYSQTSQIQTLPQMVFSKTPQMTQTFSTQRALSYANTLPASTQFGMNYDSNVDGSYLENGEAFTSYTGMDSQTASRTSSWY